MDKSPRASPVDVGIGKKIISEIAMENKSSKFLSIEDILVKNGDRCRTDMRVNLPNIATLETQMSRESYGISKACESEMKEHFQENVTAYLTGREDASYNQKQTSVLHPVPASRIHFPYEIRNDILEEDTKSISKPQASGDISGTHSQSFTIRESSTDWWTHPLWKQLYESNVSHMSEPDFSKFFLPSYLMMSQHVLGTRLSFHSPPTEMSSESHTLNVGFNVESGDKPKDINSIQEIAGQAFHVPESTNDEDSAHTSTAIPHPPPSKPRRRRQRQAYTITQLNTLEEEFKNNRYLSSEKRESMSQALGLSENQVKAWFQNRRTKHKKQLTQHINQLSTSHHATHREDRPLSQTFHDPSSFVFASAQHPFTSLPVVPPLQLHGLGPFLNHGYPSSTSYLSLLQKMI